jgi:choline-sulfatase
MQLLRVTLASAAVASTFGAIEALISQWGIGTAAERVAVVSVGALFGASFGPIAAIGPAVLAIGFGFASTPRRDRAMNAVGALFAAITVASVAVVTLSPAEPDRLGQPTLPNVVLITVDTLRRDAVGVYGSGPITPNLDAFARSGLVYLDAVSPLPETAPAHASLLTARAPLRHGVLANGDVLATAIQTIPESFRDHGWATAAVTSSVALTAKTGLNEGFDRYDDAMLPLGLGRSTPIRWLTRAWMRLGSPARTPWLLERDGAAATASALTWIEHHRSGGFFLWIHYFEPHAPYDPAPGATGAVDHRARIDDTEWTTAERDTLRAQYAAEVTRVDAHIGQLLAGLAALGVASGTSVVVVGDHGEALGEHGVDFAHRDLFDEVVRVPLLIRSPNRPPTQIAAQVRLCDVGATLLELAGLPALEAAEGIPLLRYATGERSRSLTTTLIGHRGPALRGAPLIGFRGDGFKLIAPLDGAPAWYDLTRDPAEVTDQAADPAQGDIIRRTQARVGADAAALRDAIGGPPASDAMLEALGYRQ